MNPAQLKMFIYFVSPLLFSIVAGAFLWGLDLDRDPREVPSALIDDPVPDCSLPPLEGTGVPGFSSADFRAGKVVLVLPLSSRASNPYAHRRRRHRSNLRDRS